MMDILVPKLIPVPANYHPYSYMKAIRKTRASLVARMVKNLPAVQETWVQSLGWEDPLEEGMTTHSSILAWRIPWTEELAGYKLNLVRKFHSWLSAEGKAERFFFQLLLRKTLSRGQNLSSCLGKARWWIRWGSVFASSFYSLIPKVFCWVLIISGGLRLGGCGAYTEEGSWYHYFCGH